MHTEGDLLRRILQHHAGTSRCNLSALVGCLDLSLRLFIHPSLPHGGSRVDRVNRRGYAATSSLVPWEKANDSS